MCLICYTYTGDICIVERRMSNRWDEKCMSVYMYIRSDVYLFQIQERETNDDEQGITYYAKWNRDSMFVLNEN